MRKLCLLLSLCLPFLGQPAAFAQASPFNLNIFKTQSFTASGQTGAVIQLNGLVPGVSTVGSSYASGTITVGGTAITTVSFQVLGSSDNGATFYVLPVFSVASPTSPPVNTVTATAAGLYQFNLAGLSHVKFVTTGTFTATSVTLILTASPNASISRNGSGGGVLSLTSPGNTIAIGGTGTAPTLDLNLASANTWSQGMTIQNGLTLDTLAFTTDGEGATFTNGSEIFEDNTNGLTLVGAPAIQMITFSGQTLNVTEDTTNTINALQMEGSGVVPTAVEVATNNTTAFFASNRQASPLNSANVSEAQIGSAVRSGTPIPAFAPKFAVGDHTIALKGAVSYFPVGIVSPGATVALTTDALQTYTLNANTTASIAAIYNGMHTTIQVCQPSSGGPFSWTWPASIIGGMTASTAPSSCIQQTFDSFNGTTLQAESGSSGTTTPTLNVAAALPHLIACTAKVKTNQGGCRVFAVGDSTTAGAYALNTGDTGDVFAVSYPTLLSKYLNNAILPSQRGSFMGDGAGNMAVVSVNDARVTMGGWIQGDLNSTGGLMFKALATGAPMTFTPTDQVDTFRFWYITSPAPLGIFTYQIDGGTPVTVNENAAPSLQSITTPAVALGVHTIKFNFVSGIGVFIVGVESFNSALGSVQVTNAGWVGATTNSWASGPSGGNPWDAQVAVEAQAPDLILLSLGINDWQSGVPVATYQANLQSLVNSWKVNSDVVLVSPAPSSIATVPLSTQQQYVTAMAAVAAASNVPFVDNFSRWVSFELKNPAPFLFYNHPFHPSETGYSDFAQSIGSTLLNVIGPGTKPSSGLGAGVLKQDVSGIPALAVAGTDYLSPATGVVSFKTRQGAVTPATGDYSAAQVTNALDLSNAALQTMTGSLAIPTGQSLNTPAIKDASGNAVATFASGAATFSSGVTLTGGGISNSDFKINSSFAIWVSTLRDTAGASVMTTSSGTAAFPNRLSLTGGFTDSLSNALSGSAALFTGTPITGGTGSTTTPLILIQPTGTTSNTWQTTGTMFGINAASGFTGDLFSFQTNGGTQLHLSAGGTLTGGASNFANYQTSSNCASSASPAVCAAAAGGSVAVPAGTNPTLTVNTTRLLATSQIYLFPDQSLGSRLSVTCNTTVPTNQVVTARVAGTSFTFQVNGTFSTNPVCYDYLIFN